MFDARANALGSLVNGHTNVTVAITHPSGNAGIRIVNVAYSAQNNTIFSGILNTKTMDVSGTSTAQASTPPNIDFYLLLDNSPSMSLPTTQDGITQMQNLTSKQASGVGCAFACHQASTNNSDTAGNLCSTGGTNPTYSSPTSSSNTYCASKNSQGQTLTQIDNYAMARRNNITLRLDELTSGISTLMTTANTYQNSGIYTTPPVYRFAAYSMDSLWQIGTSNTQLMTLTGSYESAWSTAKSGFGVMEMYANNQTCGNSSCTSAGSQGDVATSYNNAMSSINSTMPTPGNGTNITGDKPQEVLFLVTDGVEDDTASSCTRPMTGSRCQAPINPTLCTTLKNRGVKIAILYTEYLQVPANSWYSSWIAPFQPDIGSKLQACASPNLYYDAAIGSDLGQALSQLFQAVVQNASLSN